MDQTLQEEYKARINKAFDYIETHLDHQFTLEELARAANFSKFHFHRIFMACVGETPFQFINRIRLERAASLLITAKKESITDVALKCGFTDISVFSRNFKSYFNQAPSNYRKNKQAHSNQNQINSKTGKAKHQTTMYFCSSTNTIKWRTSMKLNKGVEIKNLEPMTVAYIRHIGPYAGNDKLFEGLWNKLFTWAGPRGLVGGPDFKSLIMYHDDPMSQMKISSDSACAFQCQMIQKWMVR